MRDYEKDYDKNLEVEMKIKTILSVILALFNILLVSQSLTAADNEKKLKSLQIAKLLAQRNIIEAVYGVKVRFIEEVTDLKKGNFFGRTETKTGTRTIRGIEFEEKYDPKLDIAQVTATLELKHIADLIDKNKFDLKKHPDKVIKRIAFASSNPKNADKISALRAAEIEAYKNLYKKIGGFTLESHTKVENFVLKSDYVKASVVGALMGAEYVGFRWDGKGKDAIATVRLKLNVKELADMLGQKIVNYDKEFIEAEGSAAQKEGVMKFRKQPEKTRAPKVIEEDLEMLP